MRNWVIRGDFNDVRTLEEKRGGRLRTKSSLKGFNDFVTKMGMVEIQFKGRM